MVVSDICSWTSNIKGFYFGQIWSFEGPISSANKLFPCRLLDKMWGIYIENEHLPHSLHTSLRECLLHQGVAQACRCCCNYPPKSFTFTFFSKKLCHARGTGTARGRGRAQTDVTSRLRSFVAPRADNGASKLPPRCRTPRHTPTRVIIRIAPSQSISL